MISCQKFTEIVEEAREGKSSSFDRAMVKLHHLICPSCKAFMRGMDATVAALHELPDEPAPDDAKALVMKRLRDKRGG